MRILSVAALLLAGLYGLGCARDPGACCDAFGPSDEPGVYCRAHKDAVLQFVRDGRDAAERKSRLEWIRGILKAVEPMSDSDEIHSHLAAFEKSRPEFWTAYEKHHFWAGRDTTLGLQKRGELMKCGFRHALTELDRDLR